MVAMVLKAIGEAVQGQNIGARCGTLQPDPGQQRRAVLFHPEWETLSNDNGNWQRPSSGMSLFIKIDTKDWGVSSISKLPVWKAQRAGFDLQNPCTQSQAW